LAASLGSIKGLFQRREPAEYLSLFVAMASMLLALLPLVLTNAVGAAPSSTGCTGTINSLSSIAAAVECTTIVIDAFTVPAGETFSMTVLSGSSITMGMCISIARCLVFFSANAHAAGDVTFAEEHWAGPLFELV
jgi:polygalacturonase